MTTATMPSAAAIKPGKNLPKRIFNFSAGPAILPEEVLLQCQQDIWSIFDSGIGIMEHSHRGPVFDRVIDEAKADCRAIANLSDDYEVLFLLSAFVRNSDEVNWWDVRRALKEVATLTD
jgi:phosphoserine aminotransferase